jgi:N-formylglutamate amidohydrolase
MEQMDVDGCIAAIRARKTFHASVDDGAFFIKIDDYANFVCTAIHNGHRLRAELLGRCALDDSQRLHEEDPYTADVVTNMPITVVANDSRYEYDLNRPPETCVYEEAWGQVVWSEPLSDAEKMCSLDKHTKFYTVLGVLYETLEKIYPQVLAFDVHSYNYQRSGMGNVPVFNIGTEQLDTHRWQGLIDQWAAGLGRIELPGVEVRAGVNEVFYGRGYQATFVAKQFHNTLVLPTELKKIFMDENSGQLYPGILEKLHEQFEQLISLTAGCEPA